MKSLFVPIVILLVSHYVAEVSLQVILEVPGYGVINGTLETSTYTKHHGSEIYTSLTDIE